MKTRKLQMAGLLALASLGSAFGATVNLSTLADGAGNLTATATTLTAADDYVLDKRIYVPDGKTLTIEAGVVIKATSAPDPADASALVVTTGGKLFAMGTASAPIIFTHVDDPLDGSYSITNKEKWGGVMILGKAHNNILAGDIVAENGGTLLGVADGVGYIEGLPSPDIRHQYGDVDGTGFVNDDNSGVLSYVSIRHGGTDIGANNEINGLTLGSVGSGTTIDHIEVVANGDDGIEFFGGTVDAKYISIIFCEDDYIDWDQGYTGRIQFMFGIQLPSTLVQTTGQPDVTVKYGDNGMECDGDDGFNASRSHVSNPVVYNATIIGNGSDEGLELKERTQGLIANSILANFGSGVDLNGSATPDFGTTLQVHNNLFLNNGVDTKGSDATRDAQLATDGNLFVTSSSIIDDQISASVVDGVDNFTDLFNAVPAPGTTEVETTYPQSFTDGFFCFAPYKGAFAPGEESWLEGWTMVDLKGFGVISCPADITGDRSIDASDFNAVVGAYGTTCD